MDLTLTYKPHLDGTLTVWSVGENWGFTFDNSPGHRNSPFRVLLVHGLRRNNRQIMSRAKLHQQMIEKLIMAEETEEYAPSTMIAAAALINDFPLFKIDDVEIELLLAKAAAHLHSIPTRLGLEKGPIHGPLVELSEADSAWLLQKNATLVFSDAGVPFEKSSGVLEKLGAWAFYSTKIGISSGICELEDPTSGKAELFAAEAALHAHPGPMLLVVDSHEVRIAIEGVTERSPLLHKAYQEGRLRVLQVKGHAGCIGNELVDKAARDVNNARRHATNKVHEAEAALRRKRLRKR